MGCHFLLQGIFPTQGLNLGLLHCRWTLYPLSHQRSPHAGRGTGKCLERWRHLVGSKRKQGQWGWRVVGNEIREVKRSGRVHNVKGLYAIVQVGIDSGNHQRLSRGAMPSNVTVKDDLEVVRVQRQKQRDKVGGCYNNLGEVVRLKY